MHIRSRRQAYLDTNIATWVGEGCSLPHHTHNDIRAIAEVFLHVIQVLLEYSPLLNRQHQGCGTYDKYQANRRSDHELDKTYTLLSSTTAPAKRIPLTSFHILQLSRGTATL